jgi:NAD(P)-dependent dehydrogenase (short-subunit alcohol dehydrogenase family)
MSYKSTILITGGTTGLGYEAAKYIAQQTNDALILIASRSSGVEAANALNKITGRTSVKYLSLDLASLANVRQFAADFARSEYPPISALVLNAGIQIPGDVTYTKDGLETTFGVNHVGHALLFHLLVPHLNNGARSVVTASGTHDPAQKTGLPDAYYPSAEELAHPNAASLKKNNGRQRYATSKLCNVLYTHALESRRKEFARNFTVNAMDPGLMPGTGLARDASWIERFLWFKILPHIIPILRAVISPNIHSVGESGKALARLAVGSDVEGVSGRYFEQAKDIKSSEESYDISKQAELWEWTTAFIAQDDTEKDKFRSLE